MKLILGSAFIFMACLASANTPVTLPEMPAEIDKSTAVPWAAPDYAKQESALGYVPGAFSIPKGMEDRVQFWIDVYTKYTTDQGVLHDSQHVQIVYEVVDFTGIAARADLGPIEKQKLRESMLKQRREEVKNRLVRLNETVDPKKLEGEDLRYWKLFENVNEKNKFREASDKSRLRFQLGQRDRFILGIYHSGKYIKVMEKIFREQGLPIEITRLPFVESSFDYRARSRVGASGIWQFMRSASKRLLRIDNTVDERNDPILATVAAAKFLRGNYNMLDSWPLAITAYNHGPSGVSRIVRRYRTNNIVDLVDERHGRFRFASANFFATFLAAVEVEKNAVRYFGPVVWHPQLRVEQLVLEKPISVEKVLGWFDNDVEKARITNPHVSNKIWSSKGHFQPRHSLWVPEEKMPSVQAAIGSVEKNKPENSTRNN